jgi:osmotically-inducible protein OsmY
MDEPRKHRLGWLLAGLLIAGCGKQDTDKLARVGRTAAAKAEALTGGSNNRLLHGWQAIRADLDEMALDARVSARLRWDKTLEGASIHVTADNGLVELRGTVRDMAQRTRAADLARSTVGAVEVKDELEIPARAP